VGRDLLGKGLRDVRVAVVGWTLGLSAYAALLLAAYPSVRDNEALAAYVESLPEQMLAFFGGADLTTVGGYFQAELFSYLPALLAVFTVGKAIASTVGEEESGAMDLVLAQPVPRWQVFASRFGSLAIATTVIATGLAVTLAVGGAIVGIAGANIVALAAWCYLAALLALVFGAATMAVGALASSGRAPLVVGAALAAGTFLVDGIARLVDQLDPHHQANPYHWYALTNPVAGEVSWWGLGGLLALGTALVLVGIVGFRRKDIGV
jgi:ABC-2 type transport system permease protein